MSSPSRIPLPAATIMAETRMGHRWGDQGIAPKATTVIEPTGGGAPKQSAARMQKEVRAQKGDRNYFRSPRYRFCANAPDASVGEHHLELFHDLLFGISFREGEFLHQQAARRVEHLAFAERKFLVAFEYQQIAQNLGDLQRRTGLNLFGVFPVAPVPGLSIGVDLARTQNPVNLVDHILPDHPPQTNLGYILGRDHDGHLLSPQDLEHVESAFSSGNDAALNIFDNRHSVRRVDHFLALLERQIHHLRSFTSPRAYKFRSS